MKTSLYLLLPIFLSLSFSNPTANQQTLAGPVPTDELFKEIAYQDSEMFGAFHNCQIEKFKSFFTEDLEFYHDKGGLTGYKETIDFTENSCAEGHNKIRRELIEESLEVFPVPEYGAMQIGRHHFYETPEGQDERRTGTFKFVHIWKKTTEGWKISRVVSYDH